MRNFDENINAHYDTLSKIYNQIKRDKEKPAQFLDAWKSAVKIAGEQFFHVLSITVKSATDRDELRPNWEMIRGSLRVLSTSEITFLLSINQFYCAYEIKTFCTKNGISMPTLKEIAQLDYERVNVICRLMQSHYSWSSLSQ